MHAKRFPANSNTEAEPSPPDYWERELEVVERKHRVRNTDRREQLEIRALEAELRLKEIAVGRARAEQIERLFCSAFRIGFVAALGIAFINNPDDFLDFLAAAVFVGLLPSPSSRGR